LETRFRVKTESAVCGMCDWHVLCVVDQLRQEKCELEETLEKEQEYQVNKLMRRIEKLQAEVVSKQVTLEQVSRISAYLTCQ